MLLRTTVPIGVRVAYNCILSVPPHYRCRRT
jgi:hypothetical protein